MRLFRPISAYFLQKYSQNFEYYAEYYEFINNAQTEKLPLPSFVHYLVDFWLEPLKILTFRCCRNRRHRAP